MVLSLGYLSDKLKIYVLLQIVTLFATLGAGTIVYDINYNENLTVLFDIGFIIVNGFHPALFMLCITTMAKSCGESTRGSMFFLNGCIGSIGILLIQLVGGKLFDEYSHNWPFIIGFTSMAVFLV